MLPRPHRQRRLKKLLVSSAAVAAVTLALFVAFVAAGKAFRSENEVLLSMTLDQTPEVIYEILTDYGNLPAWLDQAETVQILRQQEGTTIWTTGLASGEQMSVFAMEIEPPIDLTWRLTSENRHVSGYWRFVLTPDNDGTHFSLKASGVAHHPVYRLTRESLIDDETQLQQFLEALARKFGDAPAIIESEKQSHVLVYGYSSLMDRIDRSAARLK